MTMLFANLRIWFRNEQARQVKKWRMFNSIILQTWIHLSPRAMQGSEISKTQQLSELVAQNQWSEYLQLNPVSPSTINNMQIECNSVENLDHFNALALFSKSRNRLQCKQDMLWYKCLDNKKFIHWVHQQLHHYQKIWTLNKFSMEKEGKIFKK